MCNEDKYISDKLIIIIFLIIFFTNYEGIILDFYTLLFLKIYHIIYYIIFI